MTNIGTRKLGVNGPEVSALGLGAMGMPTKCSSPAPSRSATGKTSSSASSSAPCVPTGLVRDVLLTEERKFSGLMSRGRSVLRRLYPEGQLTEDDYSYLRATHGLPRELVTELASDLRSPRAAKLPSDSARS